VSKARKEGQRRRRHVNDHNNHQSTENMKNPKINSDEIGAEGFFIIKQRVDLRQRLLRHTGPALAGRPEGVGHGLPATPFGGRRGAHQDNVGGRPRRPPRSCGGGGGDAAVGGAGCDELGDRVAKIREPPFQRAGGRVPGGPQRRWGKGGAVKGAAGVRPGHSTPRHWSPPPDAWAPHNGLYAKPHYREMQKLS